MRYISNPNVKKKKKKKKKNYCGTVRQNEWLLFSESHHHLQPQKQP